MKIINVQNVVQTLDKKPFFFGDCGYGYGSGTLSTEARMGDCSGGSDSFTTELKVTLVYIC